MTKQYRLVWCQVEHINQLLTLLEECFPDENWTRSSLSKFTRPPHNDNTIKVLADKKHNVIGALFYTLQAKECRIRRIAVRSDMRRQGHATSMIHSLIKPDSSTRREYFTVRVREDYLDGQLFFRDSKLGFKFDPKTKHRYEKPSQRNLSGYTFRFHKNVGVPV